MSNSALPRYNQDSYDYGYLNQNNEGGQNCCSEHVVLRGVLPQQREILHESWSVRSNCGSDAFDDERQHVQDLHFRVTLPNLLKRGMMGHESAVTANSFIVTKTKTQLKPQRAEKYLRYSSEPSTLQLKYKSGMYKVCNFPPN